MRGVAVRPVRNGAQQGLAAQVKRLQREVAWLRGELARRDGPQAGPHRVYRASADIVEGRDAGAGTASGAAGPDHPGSEPESQQPAPERSSMQGEMPLQQQGAHEGGEGPKAGAVAREPFGRAAAGTSSTVKYPAAALADGASQQHARGGSRGASQRGAPAAAARALPAAKTMQPAAPVSSPARPGAAGHMAPGSGPLPGSGSLSGSGPVHLVGELVGGGPEDPLTAGVGLAPADARPPSGAPETLRFRRCPPLRGAGRAATYVHTQKAVQNTWAAPAAAAALPMRAHDAAAGVAAERAASSGAQPQGPAAPKWGSPEALLTSSWQERMQAGPAMTSQPQEWQWSVPEQRSSAADLDRDAAFEAFQQVSVREDTTTRDMHTL